MKKRIEWLVGLRLWRAESPRLYVSPFGLTIDATKATRFKRKEDAQAEADKGRRFEVIEVDVYGMCGDDAGG